MTPKVTKLILQYECIEGSNYLLTMLIAWEFTLLDKNIFSQVGDVGIYGLQYLICYYIVILPESNTRCGNIHGNNRELLMQNCT
jgi:hypothetical protein